MSFLLAVMSTCDLPNVVAWISTVLPLHSPLADPKWPEGVAITIASFVRWVNQSGISNVAVVEVMSIVRR